MVEKGVTKLSSLQSEERIKLGKEIERKAEELGLIIDRQTKLLIYGVKPMLALRKNLTSMGKTIEFLIGMFPAITTGDEHSVYLFRDLETFSDFIANAQPTVKERNGSKGKYTFVNITNNQHFGESLGYPPQAVSWFVNVGLEKGRQAVLDYHGLKFGCAIDQVDYCVNWLMTYRPVPEIARTGFTVTIKNGKETESVTIIENVESEIV